LVAGGCVLAALLLLALLLPDFDLGGGSLSLPATFEEHQRQLGRKVVIEEGTAVDGRHYRFEVSRDTAGSLCSFMLLTSPRGDGGGGGGCGGKQLSVMRSSNGAVHGLTSQRIASVALTTSDGPVTALTTSLPAPFSEARYFLVVLPPGTSVSRAIGRRGNGSVVVDQNLAG
jgi:hypothetical protein